MIILFVCHVNIVYIISNLNIWINFLRCALYLYDK
jgi:hypothetical protein